jgi:DNA-binding NtrC family response regulator
MTTRLLADTGNVRDLVALQDASAEGARLPVLSGIQLSILEDPPTRSGLPDLDEHAASLLARLRAINGTDAGKIRERLDWLRVVAGFQGDCRTQRAAAYALGILHREDGLWTRAVRMFETAEAGSAIDRAWCLLRQAEVRSRIESAGRVLSLCASALRLVRATPDPILAARIRLLAASAYRRVGDPTRAWRLLDRTRNSASVVASPFDHASLRFAEAELLHETRREEAALAACRDAEEIARQGEEESDPLRLRLRTKILRRWGETLCDLGRNCESRRRADQALEVAAASRCAEEGRVRLLLARLHLIEGEESLAWQELDRGERILRRLHAHESLAKLLLIRGEAAALRLHEHGRRRSAREGLFEARAILRRLGIEKGIRQCDLLIETIRFAGNGAGSQIRSELLRRPPRVPRVRRLSQLGFLTADPRILRDLEPVESLARTTIPVLVLGESGTGKEVLARALHRACGGRGPFVGVNCGALPSELQESEMFGHVRGAFTGAIADKIGLFEGADGGTLLLDEVGEMSPRAQVKLLRVLELGEVRRVGEIRTRKIRVRVIAATNADLEACIRAGTFRRDLYYRLCGLKVELPPLRDRLGDVPLLSTHFIQLFGNHDSLPPALAPDALDLLLQHSWPGNVRELRFTVEKAVALTRALGRDRVEADCIDVDLPSNGSDAGREEPTASVEEMIAAGGLEAYVDNIERRLILKALEENGWNRTRAAKALGGMSRTTLIGKMKRLGLFPGPGERRDVEEDRG